MRGYYGLGVSTDGTHSTIVSIAEFGGNDLHHLNRVPLNQGVPMPAGIRYVRLYVLHSIGGPDEEGDPLSDGGFVGVADLQVYSAPTVGATPTPTATASPTAVPTTSPTPVPTATPTPTPSPGTFKPDLSETGKRLKLSAAGKATLSVRCVAATGGPLPATCPVKLVLSGKLPGHRKASTRASATVQANQTFGVKAALSKATLTALA